MDTITVLDSGNKQKTIVAAQALAITSNPAGTLFHYTNGAIEILTTVYDDVYASLSPLIALLDVTDSSGNDKAVAAYQVLSLTSAPGGVRIEYTNDESEVVRDDYQALSDAFNSL